MSPDNQDENYKKMMIDNADQETEGESGQGEKGGRGSQTEFRDFIGGGARLRDDQLPPDEKKRILSVHQDTHELRVKKQKEKREQYKALKEGKVTLAAHREGLGRGGQAQYKEHLLSQKAQFAGIDRQVVSLPNEQMTEETNKELRDELQNRYELRYMPQHAPRMMIKPSPFNR